MVKNIIVACCDDEVRKIVVGNASAIFGEKQVYVCKSYNDLYERSKYAQDTAVFFDKYFLGYVISYAITRLRIANRTLRCYFVEIGKCSVFFGVRVYTLGTDGFISDIEDDLVWKKNSVQLHQGDKTFLEEVLRNAKRPDCTMDRKSISEVSATEMQIGIYLGMGKSQKDICSITGLSATTVSVYTHRLKRKIGYKKPTDYNMLDHNACWNKEENQFDS